MKKTNKKGFTLTELIVVIVIIGILAGVLIPSIAGYVNKSKRSAAEQEAYAIVDVWEYYVVEAKASMTTDKFSDYYSDVAGQPLSNKVTVDSLTEPTQIQYQYKDSNLYIVINLSTKEKSFSEEPSSNIVEKFGEVTAEAAAK